MSNRMCAKCNTILDNRTYSKENCWNCGSNEMADPNEFNNEWDLLGKAQTDVLVAQAKLLKAVEVISFYASKNYYPKGGMPFFPEVDRNKDTQKLAQNYLDKYVEGK